MQHRPVQMWEESGLYPWFFGTKGIVHSPRGTSLRVIAQSYRNLRAEDCPADSALLSRRPASGLTFADRTRHVYLQRDEYDIYISIYMYICIHIYTRNGKLDARRERNWNILAGHRSPINSMVTRDRQRRREALGHRGTWIIVYTIDHTFFTPFTYSVHRLDRLQSLKSPRVTSGPSAVAWPANKKARPIQPVVVQPRFLGGTLMRIIVSS